MQCSDIATMRVTAQTTDEGGQAAASHIAGAAAPRRLRIALVTPMLPVPHDQTRGRYIHETARSLSRLADVRVFFQSLRYPSLPLLRPRSFIYGEVGRDYRLDGVDVEAFSYPAVPVVSRVLNGHVGAAVLGPRVRAWKPDLLLAYWVYPDGYAAVRVARSLGVPCVVGALGSDIHVRSGLNVWMTRKTIAAADALLTVSEAMRHTAIDNFQADPARVHTVVNGFNTSVFRPGSQREARQQLGLAEDGRYIVFVGRFVEAKGVLELLSAFSQLAAGDAKLRLVLLGDGVMRQALLERVAASGLGERVIVPGGLPPLEVARWIRASDLLTLPSWSEGYPNVVVEAVACGRPVVATDVGGTREIVNPSNGLLVAPRDVEQLRSALRAALDRHWDHDAIAAAMRRSWDDVAAETLRVCESVVATRRPGARP
ncbi:glycosyltransferase [Aquabacterium sp. A7-Y]|uniref:glycosyltransferase n=1 Tax=Aquabacterium sp. A7-Y TaxID=1349605 RepID=UPI00223DDA19|nr:glycosyltransferase [Aquabacterium sp. A7-Y]MCW7537520.1 glycosyltransferase [Aquabacterium sp. A7-Y]